MIYSSRSLNSDLESLYARMKSIVIPLDIRKSISAPLLVKVTDFWIKSDERIIIVGQETCGWKSGSVNNFDDFLSHDESIDILMKGYEKFCFASTYKYRASPFWKAYREILNAPDNNPKFETNVLWTNLARIDYMNSSILKAREMGVQEIPNQFAGIFKEEIRLLNPTKIIFFTGPNYDSLLFSEFPNISFERFDNRISRKIIAKFEIDSAEAVRTYHPAFIQRAKKWKEIVGAISEKFIKNN